ncbi:MAG: hypothetical protein CM15mP59_5170 [Flavobacteriaceae bacterium]|nr:MAG: hypothetical protein CM15mP59_5170 [Flavobacteriaceae bacterium]
MRQFLEAIKNIWKIEELRNRVGLTLGLLLVYRVVLKLYSGIDSVQLSELPIVPMGRSFRDFKRFYGGAFANASVFALGIMPIFCFYCCSVDGNRCSLSSEIAKGR